MEIEDVVGKTVVKVHRPYDPDNPQDNEDDAYVLVFADGTRVCFEPNGYSSHATDCTVLPSEQLSAGGGGEQ